MKPVDSTEQGDSPSSQGAGRQDHPRDALDPSASTKCEGAHPLRRRSGMRSCFSFLVGMISGSVLLVAVLVGMAAQNDEFKTKMNFFFMRFFRNLSRSKAHRRLHRSSTGVVLSVMLGKEELLPITEPDDSTPTFTLKELAFYDGINEPLAPLYLAIRGRVYDVSAGKAFYGPGRSYHPFLGKDATRAYGTGCLRPECLIASTTGLTLRQLKEVHLGRVTHTGVRVKCGCVADSLCVTTFHRALGRLVYFTTTNF
mmetsp:Transcript_27160/g.59357  ORF Transcript_27160/g.59357 Transcript_27160/m.59357 type:complete len:255 (+) Transcript_27160:174-938(+)